MLSLSKLSQDEIKYICGRIPLPMARRYFQRQPKAFAKIRPGFRAEKLSDADTLSIIIKNYKQPFISNFIENVITDWLSQIKDHIHGLENEGYSNGEALLKTLPESFFSGDIELYFKITEESYTEDFLKLFRDALTLIQKEENEEKTIANDASMDDEAQEYAASIEADKTIQELNEKLAQTQEIKKILEETINKMKESAKNGDAELERIAEELKEAKLNISELEAELDHYHHLESYADTEFEQSDYIQFQHISIGRISHDYNGQIWINRLADIVEGEIFPFYVDETEARYFANRDRIYWKDGPNEEGAIGVWNWKAEARNTDATKDFITCEYNSDARVTEIIEFLQYKTITELSELLLEGFEMTLTCNKVLFVITNSNGTKEGILCNAGDFENYGTKMKLASSVFMLPNFCIKQSDIIKIAGIKLYRKMNLGAPQSIIRIRTPYDAVKSMLLSRVTIPALREYDLSKKEAQHCKRFFEGLPTKTLIQELSDVYACTEAEAKGYINDFINFADTYLSAEDFDMNVISNALSRSPELVDLCKKQLAEEWENENNDRITEARKELDEIQKDVQKKQEDLQISLQSKNELIDELEKIRNQIMQQEQLATDVEKSIAARIKSAKEDAAEFISQMAFLSSASVSVSAGNDIGQLKSVPVIHSNMKSEDGGEIDDIDTFEEELTDNLMHIGYNEETAVEMAQAISYCFCNNIMLVVGENSVAVSQCIASTIGGKELSEIVITSQDVPFETLNNVILGEKNEKDSVFLLHGVLDGYNVSLFNALSSLTLNAAYNKIIILSLEGIQPHMIPAGIWNHAIYIDGDKGLVDMTLNLVKSYEISMEYEREIDKDEYKEKKKQLGVFLSVLSNMQICRYAKYLASYNLDLNDSQTVLSQIITVGKSLGMEEKLKSLFRENGISNGEKMLSNI